MSHIQLLAAAALALIASGCANVPMAPTELDAQAKQFSIPAGKANLYINRGGGLGTAVVIQLQLDGLIVGSLAPYTYHLISVSPGKHTIAVFAGTENARQSIVTLEAGHN